MFLQFKNRYQNYSKKVSQLHLTEMHNLNDIYCLCILLITNF